jgi:transposase InsO family protein
MPWHQTDPVSERLKFVAAVKEGLLSMTDLCRAAGISRKTGYKILSRYERDGPEGLLDRSRAPWTHPNRTPAEIEAAVLRVRKAWPTWGSKKILAVLRREGELESLPARSTVDGILRRAGLVTPRGKRSRRQPSAPPLVQALEPNDVWSIDYKGWFKVRDGTRCDPLTINDVFSRASLECRALVAPKLEDVRSRLDVLFREHGLPHFMLSDNGPPFASRGIGRLSRLGVWLLRLGVTPVLIQPGRPEQNGCHERFHRTLKAETTRPPKATIRAQQRAFDRFRRDYNEQRPHESLDQRVPAEIYKPSKRAMPRDLPEYDYPGEFELRRVSRGGTMKWLGRFIFVGEALAGETVGLECVDEQIWQLHLGPMPLGVLHERSGTIVPLAQLQ